MVRGYERRSQTKKLEEAAAHYIGRGLKPKVIDQTDSDLEAFGLVSQEPEQESEPPFEVWPENKDAVTMFVAASTQWRTGPGGVTGLDYNALFRLMELYVIKDQRETLEAVQVMESTALKMMAEHNSDGHN